MLEVFANRTSIERGQTTHSEYEYDNLLTTITRIVDADLMPPSGNDNRSNIGGEGDRHSSGTLASHGTNHGSYFYNTRHQRVVISSSASRAEGDQQEIIWDDIISGEV
ncbi:hypothetical protein EPUS_03065 [Endocarpon pusillum Z07020]|uniref:Uncharacterized protein n=1 Tax=Endocarpon pusillum (strain Z07020 / HMAS-L-300199) TaxID=1263415 RepID=U1HV61_ENDPU|nr:uncharacterized protein EPUS_03065 [Endocarpon pusillum Z07020]ERF73224.1 hypothetical protein EPUS_03065 [Endocarpon pusillum Z07020]